MSDKILTCLDVRDNLAREAEYVRAIRTFGYLPIYGPTIEDVHYAKELVNYIMSEYPGYRWIIEVRNGMVTCVNETFCPDYGFRLYVSQLDNDGKEIKRWAGGLLERFGVPRSKMVVGMVDELVKDSRGNVKRLN